MMRLGGAGAPVRTVARVIRADERAHGCTLLAPLDHAHCPLRGHRVDDLAGPAGHGSHRAAGRLGARHGGNGSLLDPPGEREEGRDVLGGAEPAVPARRRVELHQLVRTAGRQERLPVLLLVLRDDEPSSSAWSVSTLASLRARGS